jgi:hypothetical protein
MEVSEVDDTETSVSKSKDQTDVIILQLQLEAGMQLCNYHLTSVIQHNNLWS